MSYLVLARKYRPQTFGEIVGQEHVTRTLANAFASDRVHHAFLFCGPRGVGKTTAARCLGKALNCEKAGPTPEPCGECSACVSIQDGSATDYHEMDGASNRGIDAIRELTEAVRYQPAALRKKVYVIDEVHMLTTEAFNALLKTLEEPPPHVTFVLATTEPHKLPNTILSRCQRYDFKLVPASRLTEHILSVLESEAIEIEPAAASLIVRESGGSVRDALSLCDQIISYVGDQKLTEALAAEVLGVADRALTGSITSALVAGDVRAALEKVDSAGARGVDEVQLARSLTRYLRDLTIAQLVDDSTGLTDASPEEHAEIRKQADAIAPARVRQMFERLLSACDDLGQTQQPRLVLELALIDLATLEPLEPIGGLIERLADLEQRIARGGGSLGGGGASGGGGGRGRPAQRAVETPGTVSPASQRPPSRQAADPAPARARDAESPPKSKPAADPPSQQSTGESPNTPALVPDTAQPSSGKTPAAPPSKGRDYSAWEGVIAALEEAHKLSLVRLFHGAKLLGMEPGAVQVGYPKESIDLDLAREKDNTVAMTDFLTAHFGTPTTLEVRELATDEAAESPAASARSLHEIEAQRRRDSHHQHEQDVREHPMTQAVLSTFGASIKEIKTNV